jgi:hypothetical protein
MIVFEERFLTRAIFSMVSCIIPGVSGVLAHMTTWIPDSRYPAASRKWAIPFWRVSRATASTNGLSGSIPYFFRTEGSFVGRY